MPATYKIGEAAALLNLKTYILRFWETEFPQIAPLRTEKGQRLYTEEHLALLERIRFLLHERGLTIEGARRALKEEAGKGMRYPLPQALQARQAAVRKDAPEGVKQPRSIPDQGLLISPTRDTPPREEERPVPFSSATVEPSWDDSIFASAVEEDSFLEEIAEELLAIAVLLRGPHSGNLQ